LFDKRQQVRLGSGKESDRNFTAGKRLAYLGVRFLQLLEVLVGNCSVPALIQGRIAGGDHFLLTPRKKAIRELQRIRDVDGGLKQVGTQTKALQDIWDLLATSVFFFQVSQMS
jgi:hypothetical protein